MYDMLRKLDTKRATGPDGISNKLLRVTAYGIADSVTKLINKSLSLGEFPTEWKKANVVAIHKKSSVHEVSNYRPISLLSCLSKICERVVATKLRLHLEANQIISSFQSGYRVGFSTQTQLASLVHDISQAVDQGKVVRAVFLDISKAFDRVSHKGLLIKLQQIGIAGTLLKWFKSYLGNRRQCVVLDGVSSTWLSVGSGVPQGSVLGPLLFIIYINDLLQTFSCGVQCYADDTMLFQIGDNIRKVDENLSKNLEKAEKWGKTWLVEFNESKTESMTFGMKKTPNPFYFCGSRINEVQSHKHLGLILTSTLQWNEQVNEMYEKAEKRLRYLIVARYHVTQAVLQNIYLTLIRPVMEYSCAVWSNITLNTSNKLQDIQNRAARLVTGAIKNTSIDRLHNELGWPMLDERRKYFRLVFYYKLISGELPSYLQVALPKVTHSYSTRNNQTKTFAYNKNQFGNSLLPLAAREYNDLDAELRKKLKLSTFKKHLKDNLFTRKPPPPFYRSGSFYPNSLHCRLRMGYSTLRADIFRNTGLVNPVCQSCNVPETVTHFLLQCNDYNVIREPMIERIRNILEQNGLDPEAVSSATLVDTLLRGSENLTEESNSEIFEIVRGFILETRRFAVASTFTSH